MIIFHLKKLYVKSIRVLLHEFGHSWAIYRNGNQYNSWNFNYKENWAIEFSNSRYSNFVGRPNEIFYWTFQINISRWINFLYPSTGGRGWNP